MPRKRSKPGDPIELSRTAIEDFLRCPRCFFLHRKKGLKAIPRVPMTLAVATDALLKNEFDLVRSSGASHPLWEKENLPVRAFSHPDMEAWRNNFKGLRVTHQGTGATIYGAIDDIWEHRESGALHIVDYKSTAKQGTPDIEGGFGPSYKRQMEIYQWLFRQTGFSVSSTGYFLYVNGIKEGHFYEHGEGRMRFDTTLIAYEGETSWVDASISAAVACFSAEAIPAPGAECDTCRYVESRAEIKI